MDIRVGLNIDSTNQACFVYIGVIVRECGQTFRVRVKYYNY